MATLYPKHLKHEWQAMRRARSKKKRIKYQNKYNEQYYRVYRAFFDRRTEQDVIDWLEANKPYKQAILRAIRHEIEKEKAEAESLRLEGQQ